MESKQEKYLMKVADYNFEKIYNQGFAVPGHNGPHGHLDTPVRNTSHYLIIYSYLFKKTKCEKYLKICDRLADYLCRKQKESSSGAIQCMQTDSFDHLNGLIGQAWVIEALLYYYDLAHDEKVLSTALKIFYSQKYDRNLHLWHRIELDGRDIGIDPTYNHHVWFAACSYKLSDYCQDEEINSMIIDFLEKGADRDFRLCKNGVLQHHVNVNVDIMKKIKIKNAIKTVLSPFKKLNEKKLDTHYIEYAYHIFDLYGFSILRERYADLPIYSSDRYNKAVKYASQLNLFNKNCGVDSYVKKGKPFNIYSYSYNSPAFELPFVAVVNGFGSKAILDATYETQEKLMLDKKTGFMNENQPDIETWNARTYEIIRYCEYAKN